MRVAYHKFGDQQTHYPHYSVQLLRKCQTSLFPPNCALVPLLNVWGIVVVGLKTVVFAVVVGCALE